MATSVIGQYWRIRAGTTFTDATPNLPAGDWSVTQGAGWSDIPPDRDTTPLKFGETSIFPSVAAGARSMNAADPVAGLTNTELGSLSMAWYPELMHNWLDVMMGTTNKVATPTAGIAARASETLTTLAALDTQPTSDEVIVFTIASSVATTGIVISIIQSGATVETVTVPDGTGGSADGAYYTKGAYNGGTNALTFSVAGTAASANVTVSGIKYVSTVWKMSPTTPTAIIEQGGRAEIATANSQYATGVVVNQATIEYDRTAADGLLMFNPTVLGNYVDTTKTSGPDGDAATYYKPLAGWNGLVSIDAVTNYEIQTCSIAINPNDEMVQVSSGNQGPTAKTEGYFEVVASITLIPAAVTRFSASQAQTAENWAIVFSSPYMVNASQAWSLTLDMSNAFYEEYTPGTSGMVQSADITLRGVYDATDGGAIKITQIDRRPV